VKRGLEFEFGFCFEFVYCYPLYVLFPHKFLIFNFMALVTTCRWICLQPTFLDFWLPYKIRNFSFFSILSVNFVPVFWILLFFPSYHISGTEIVPDVHACTIDCVISMRGVLIFFRLIFFLCFAVQIFLWVCQVGFILGWVTNFFF
jgi:hypothetical protein